MFTISNITWTVKQIVSMVEGNKKSVMRFDDEIQRDTVWKKEQKSLFIDSILRGYPIPPLYAEKYDNEEKRIYNVLDGKQRCTTLYGFVKGSFELSDDLDNIENDFGEDVDVSGCKFNELPEDLQDKILDKTLTVYYCEGMTEDEKSEMFYRLNNGKPLSSVVPVVKMAIDNGMEVDAFTDWVRNFFTNTPEEYAKAAKDGVNHKENVKIRHRL